MPLLVNSDHYAILRVNAQEDWNLLPPACGDHLTTHDLQKLFEYLKNDVKSVVVEKEYIDKDYRDTFSNFYSKKFSSYPSSTTRIHFFRSEVNPDELFSLETHSREYIGFSVIRPTQINSIGRTIFDPSKVNEIQGVICRTEYRVHLFGTELIINGFPYISQDTDVTICAHAATWMVFRYYSERYKAYREIYPFQISQLSSDVSRGRLVPSKGLTAFQITEIFSNYGFYPEVYLKEYYTDNFYRLLYYYIESGIPIVACLRQKMHALTIIGHISDYNRPVKENSEEFLTGYVLNDDNYLPYQLAMRPGLTSKGHASPFHIDDIDGFIVPLYEKMYLSAEHIETLVSAILQSPNLGINSRSKLVKYDNLIKRIFLTSSNSYKAFRKRNPIPFELQKFYLQMPMSKFLWVCELSTIDIYKNKKIIGEILFDATSNHWDRFCFLAIHYPDAIILNDRNKFGDKPDRFEYYDLPSDKSSPYAMYENNLKEI